MKKTQFSKTIQVTDSSQFASMRKGQMFSTVYAPIEGRFLWYKAISVPEHVNVFERKNIVGHLEWKTQGHKKRWGFVFADDFELQETVISKKLERVINVLCKSGTELAFEKDPTAGKLRLKALRAISKFHGIEHIGLEIARSAMATRRNFKATGII